MTATPGTRRSLGLLVAGALFMIGAVAGVALDRLWLRASQQAEPPLTVDAMADALGLDATAAARVRALVDSLDAAIARAAEQGPEALRAEVREARRRLEAAIPMERRQTFREWLRDRHASMLDHLGRGPGPHRGPPARRGPPLDTGDTPGDSVPGRGRGLGRGRGGSGPRGPR